MKIISILVVLLIFNISQGISQDPNFFYNQKGKLLRKLCGKDTIAYSELKIAKQEIFDPFADSIRQYTYYELPDKTILKHGETIVGHCEEVGFRDYLEIYGKKYLLNLIGGFYGVRITTIDFNGNFYIFFVASPANCLSPATPQYIHVFVVSKKAFDRSQPNNIYTANNKWEFRNVHFRESNLFANQFYKNYDTNLQSDELCFMHYEDNHRNIPDEVESSSLIVGKHIFVPESEDGTMGIYVMEKENKEWYYVTYGFKDKKLVLIENKWHFPISLE